VPGAAPLSSLRRQVPAGHHRPAPNQPVEYDASHQFAIISGLQLSAILTKPSPRNAAAATNPHRRSSVHRFPAGSFFRGFRTPALYRIDRSCSDRHPKPFRIAVIRECCALKKRGFPVEQRRRQHPETVGLQTVAQSANLSLAV
jgi:hypothetical protein